MGNGGVVMANIYEFVKKSNNRRPVFTSYELSKMVKDKREKSGLNSLEFAAQYEISENMLLEIEQGSCSFSPKYYKACGQILNLSVDELLGEFVDDLQAANFRTTNDQRDVQETFEMANMLFNEIIMQMKIGIN